MHVQHELPHGLNCGAEATCSTQDAFTAPELRVSAKARLGKAQPVQRHAISAREGIQS
jgi:hypothetical protein